MDTLCGLEFKLSMPSFYQVNRDQAEVLYGKALEFAGLTGKETVLDLYCGIGTITLCLAKAGKAGHRRGDRAPRHPGRQGECPPQPHRKRGVFLRGRGGHRRQAGERRPAPGCSDGGSASEGTGSGGHRLRGGHGAGEGGLRLLRPGNAGPGREDSSGEFGYEAKRAAAVDMFPGTAHVETVVLLSKGEVDSKKIRVEFSLEDMDMSEFQDGATYPQIKEYVLEHTGLKVSNLYISQIKTKMWD